MIPPVIAVTPEGRRQARVGSQARPRAEDPLETLRDPCPNRRRSRLRCPTRLVGLAASQFLRGVSVFRLKGLSFGEPSDDKVGLTERKRLGEIVVGAQAKSLDAGVEQG